MKNTVGPAPSATPVVAGKVARPTYAPGTYLGCTACGRLLRIQWPTRSVVCSCGARVAPTSSKPEPSK
jgi:hypothetical protein